jgi:hypothetical protein
MPDISRSTFRREKHYDTVRMQQGRVFVDADQNESEDIQRHLRETTARDIIGRTGVPRDNPGFRIVLGPNSEPLISAGRMYVDGILCENEGILRATAASTTTLTLEDPSPLFPKNGMLEVFGAKNDQPFTSTHSISAANGKTLTIQPALDAGATVHLVHALIPWSKQPDFFGGALPTGNYMLYLDVWRREITYLEDPDIREVALGGPDTTTRTKTVWQVRGIQNGTCAGFTSPRKNDARLAAKTIPPKDTKPCDIPEAAGYRRLENQLYRVQIHKSSKQAGGPTFKWSRDNGAIVFPLDPLGNDPTKIELRSIGLDERTSLHDNDWVEVINDFNDLDAVAGQLLQVDRAPEASDRVVTLKGGTIPGSFDRKKNARLRVWNDPESTKGEFPVDTTQFVELEDGIHVQFSGTEFNSGDYWLIPARTAISEDTGTILWPFESGNPLFLRPEGVVHHYAPLAEVTSSTVKDCRQFFPPITTPDLFYVSGDGQNVKPDPNGGLAPLPCKLRVRVSNGMPVAGAKVTFTLPPGQAGLLTPNAPATGPDGVIACDWSVNPKDADQYATATLDLPGVTHPKPSIIFHAQLDLSHDAGPCTIVIHEGDNVAERFDEVKNRKDIEICFGTGDFKVDEPLRLINRKRVKVTGAGPATRLHGGRSVVLFFDDCEEILIRDLAAAGTDLPALDLKFPAGVLSFRECNTVSVEHVAAACATPNSDDPLLACLSTHKCETLRIRDCLFSAGSDQFGLYVEDSQIALIEGNVVLGRPRTNSFRGINSLVANFDVTTGRKPRATARRSVLTVGGVHVTFEADDAVVDDLEQIVAQSDVSGVKDAAGARKILSDAVAGVAADPARLSRFTGLARAIRLAAEGGAAFGIFARTLDRDDMVVTIRDNEVRGADIGIQVSPLSADEPDAKGVARTAIENNEVAMLPAQMPPPPQNLGTPPPPVPVPVTINVPPVTRSAATRNSRMFGIASGSCGSLLIEGNLITSPQRIVASLGVFQFGIVGNGVFGPFAILRANDIREFATGAVMVQVGTPNVRQWRLITNLAFDPVGKAWVVDDKVWVLENNVPPV